MEEIEEIQALIQAYKDWCKTKDDELRLAKEDKWAEYRIRIAELTGIPQGLSNPPIHDSLAKEAIQVNGNAHVQGISLPPIPKDLTERQDKIEWMLINWFKGGATQKQIEKICEENEILMNVHTAVYNGKKAKRWVPIKPKLSREAYLFLPSWIGADGFPLPQFTPDEYLKLQ